jgi:predicted ABC-class ATPase
LYKTKAIMKSSDELKRILHRIDGRGYKAYKDIEGVYDFGNYLLFIDHCQGDPFASPSRIRVEMSQSLAGFPQDTHHTKSRNVGLCDYIARIFHSNIKRYSQGIRGTGGSGLIEIDNPGQEILERTSVNIDPEKVEARFYMGLPAAGRRILGRVAIDMFFQELPKIIDTSLFFAKQHNTKLYHHIKTNEDADHIRAQLDTLSLVTFIANHSILPRASGVDPSPMKGPQVVPFKSPHSLEVTIDTPNHGIIKGLGIPKGVTLIVGGGYHGKSTLLQAIQLGIYNHIPGDGREYTTTNPSAIKIRAEDGRRIEKVDISPFISNLPQNKTTHDFSTEDASGSTSQATNIIEAIEAGTTLLLMDEDTSATNFMIRDHRMQELVAKEKEPITPYIDKVRHLSDIHISTILVIGGSGDYFDVADLVIKMEDYLPYNVTEGALAIAHKYQAERKKEGGNSFGNPLLNRIPIKDSFDARKGKRETKVSIKGLQTILFGRRKIDLSPVEQLVNHSQTRAVADAIIYIRNRYMNGNFSLREILNLFQDDLNKNGLDMLSRYPQGNYALPRPLEIAAAINRMPGLKIEMKKK